MCSAVNGLQGGSLGVQVSLGILVSGTAVDKMQPFFCGGEKQEG